VVPRARGAADRLNEEAEGYRARIVAQAEGDSQRFRSILAEYQKAPQVTRERLYVDAMQEVYSNVTKVVVDSKSGNNLLYLPLDKIMQLTGPTGAANSTAPSLPPSTAPASTPASRSLDNAARSRERDVR
jgi:membrane protease subunit HflK